MSYLEKEILKYIKLLQKKDDEVPYEDLDKHINWDLRPEFDNIFLKYSEAKNIITNNSSLRVISPQILA